MPIIHHQTIEPQGNWAIWEIREAESWFRDHLELFPVEESMIREMNDQRRLEWLAARLLLHEVLGEQDRTPCLKDSYGKPYLQDRPVYLSMSHSHDLASVILAPVPVGIDIQYRVAKLQRIASKFVTEKEIDVYPGKPDLDFLHVLWSAKECIYKAYGKRGLDFREHLHIYLDEKVQEVGTCEAFLVKEDLEARFAVRYEWFEPGFVLVYAMQV
ncbi:MAG: 4'-phosphopantetheinyl transferase superfamily protein [Saprospiraceae bacterium]|nr:4'-phosphopantetheinyl transferase superfamily protein [Saprospiraceae bacterium]